MKGVSWSYFNKFDDILNKYMPSTGEGKTMASQLVTAVNKLVYKWYNDGDVYDNTHSLDGLANDLSSYANWLYKYIPESSDILIDVYNVRDDSEYENLLKMLCDELLVEDLLNKYALKPSINSIYSSNLKNPFKFIEYDDDDDDDEFIEYGDYYYDGDVDY